MKSSFEVPFQLPGLNEIIQAAKTSKHAYALLKRRWMHTCLVYIRLARLSKLTEPCQASFEWTEPDGARDLDNICAGTKFLLDALVVTGILKDDSPAWVTNISHVFMPPNKKNPRVVVTLMVMRESVDSGRQQIRSESATN